MLRTKLFALLFTGYFLINLLPLQAQVLQQVRTVEITTDATGRGARPEIHFANNRFYIIYLGIIGPAKTAFKVKVYDSSLENVLTEKIIVESDTAYGGTTDIRSVADSEGVYLFFEKANKVKDAAFLFGEKYAFDEEFTKANAYDGPIIQGAYWQTSEAGDELLDDPASVIVGNRVYVMTKIKGGGNLFTSVPTYRVRGLDANLSQVDTTFDLTIPEMRGWAFVNSLLHTDNSIYHLQPSLASASPPVNLDLRLVRFSEQWQYESSDVLTISNESWSESMLTGFIRDKDGFYYLTFVEPAESPDPTQTGPSGGHLWLKMYDSNFNEIQAISLLDTAYLGTHPTLAIVGDSVYVAYGRSVPAPYKENVVVKVYRKDISVGIETPDDAVPVHFKLLQNYPNPFNPSTTIEYQIPISSHVVLRIFNVLGQEVRTLVNGNQSAGSHSVVWNGKDSFGKEVAGGIYFFRMRTKDFVQTKKLLLLK